MALLAPALTAACLARATGLGLIDAPPNFALSRVYSVIAEGIVKTLLDSNSVTITIGYGPGQPPLPPAVFGSALSQGWDNIDPERFHPLVQNAAGFFGPFASPFFFGLGGIIEHIRVAVTMTDQQVPTANGTGLMSPGGVLFNAADCFSNMHDEAKAEGIMVVKLLPDPTGHVPDALTPFPDPVTGEDLFVDDLFSQAEILLQATATVLALELLNATKAGIVVAGVPNLVATPTSGVTITSLLT